MEDSSLMRQPRNTMPCRRQFKTTGLTILQIAPAQSRLKNNSYAFGKTQKCLLFVGPFCWMDKYSSFPVNQEQSKPGGYFSFVFLGEDHKHHLWSRSSPFAWLTNI